MIARALVAILFASLLAGCSASGSIEKGAPVTVALSDHPVVRLDISCDNPEDEDVARLVEAKLAARLKSAGVFEKIVTPELELGDPSLDLRVRVVVHGRVSMASRAWVGALAGQAGVELDVELVRLASGDSVGSMVAAGKSSGGTTFAGTTAEAVTEAVDQVVEYLLEHASPSSRSET